MKQATEEAIVVKAAAKVEQAAEVEQAAIELATIVHSEGVVIDVAYKVAAADVKTYTKLAESHGHMITAAEAELEERLRWELEFADQPERWMGCDDAASPQGKQHRLRSRTKKKKKKKKR